MLNIKMRLFLMLLLFFQLSFSQNNISGKVIYEILLKKIDDKKLKPTDKLDGKTKVYVEKLFKNAKNVKTELLFNQHSSLYKVIDELKTDDKLPNFTGIFAEQGT